MVRNTNSFSSDLAHGIEYPSVIVEISPREYKHICDGKLDLKARGWMVGSELPVSKRGDYKFKKSNGCIIG